jgi:hypothetical protein
MTVNDSDVPDLALEMRNATAAVVQWGHELANASAGVAEARRRETDARNRLNEAQKGFDALTMLIRGQAPQGSDWKRQPGQPA